MPMYSHNSDHESSNHIIMPTFARASALLVCDCTMVVHVVPLHSTAETLFTQTHRLIEPISYRYI